MDTRDDSSVYRKRSFFQRDKSALIGKDTQTQCVVDLGYTSYQFHQDFNLPEKTTVYGSQTSTGNMKDT